MSTLFVVTLASHVVLGVIAVFLSYLGVLHILKKTPNKNFLSWVYAVSALGLFLSWATGAYYYVLYYGGNVKPRILEGPYPWAHQVFMEAKEHVFIFLPFLALTLWLVARSGDAFLEQQAGSQSSKYVATVAVILGTAVALSGIIISGAFR